MNWKEFEDEQKNICNQNNIKWTPVDQNLMIAINDSLFSESVPINGLRHPKTENLEGWYIWSGGEIPQNKIDFFYPIHIFHLIQEKPEILKYLGMPIGYGFQIDYNDYEDIWYDEKIEFI